MLLWPRYETLFSHLLGSYDISRENVSQKRNKKNDFGSSEGKAHVDCFELIGLEYDLHFFSEIKQWQKFRKVLYICISHRHKRMHWVRFKVVSWKRCKNLYKLPPSSLQNNICTFYWWVNLNYIYYKLIYNLLNLNLTCVRVIYSNEYRELLSTHFRIFKIEAVNYE